ncbi:VOC family protein [Sphingomonas sp. ID0503]|uniref:VOC family protein n=1 Tax=Sphingomonas sp. ID0503 TaxID=3399691 RepID=UPI003AFAA60D
MISGRTTLKNKKFWWGLIMLKGQKLAQVAYCVPDVAAAAEQHSRLFGSGPFYLAEHVPIRSATYRGAPAEFDHSAAFGQWGDVMVELLTLHTPGPSIVTDVFRNVVSPTGLHHLAFIVDDPHAAIAAAAREGFDLSLHVVLETGLEAFFVDTVPAYGHLTELYAPSPEILSIYDFIREQSIGFDGTNPVRSLQIGAEGTA